MLSRRSSSSPPAALLPCVLTLLLFLSATSVSAFTGMFAGLPTQLYTTECDGTAGFCVSSTEGSTLTANGRTLEPTQVCAERTFIRLDLNKAFAGLGVGPYEVIWKAGPGAYRTRLPRRDSLLYFLQASAPEAGWRKNGKGQLIALPNRDYGPIIIVDASTSASAKTTFDSIQLATDHSYRLTVGTYRLVATDADGADTTMLSVLCTPTEKRTVTILQGVKGLHCLPGTAPADTYKVTTLEAPSVAKVGEVKVLGLCLDFEGRAVGTAVGLFERCHTPTGECVRFEVTFKVTGSGPAAKLILRDDYAALAWNGQDAISVLLNDQIDGDITSLAISTEPRGTARVDPRNRIHYDAPTDWCGSDSLRYIACTASGCGEATLRIQVSCEKLIVFTGFSPNGDGLNDHFTVLGLENHPENKLLVFNEYGHEVFSSTGYANDWAGLSHGSPLSSGTYYYVLTVKDYAMLSGYVQLQR